MSNKLRTPWGEADNVKRLSVDGGDILCVDTPSHGGYFVPDELLSQIPKEQRQWAAKWSQSENWYEEDCCWAAVALAFPSLFPDNALVYAADLVKTYCGRAQQ
jgi:uncharacterized protein DUF7007